jgi:hypothetical protein
VEKVLAVYDVDSMYATRFMEFFQKRKDCDFEIIAFTKKESLIDFLKQKKIEILLYEESSLPEEIPKENIKYFYKLSERPGAAKEMEIPEIYKYQAAPRIMTEIISDYNKRENITSYSYRAGNVEILTAFAPVPSGTKMIFTWSMAVNLSETKKVLFIPLDSIPVSVLLSEDDSNHGLSEFIYYLKENNPNIISKLKTLVQYLGNLSYLSGITHGMDLFSLSREEVSIWCDELRNNSGYHTVIFYSNHYSEAMLEVLNKSDQIVILMKDSSYEKAVYREWERQINFIGLKDKLPQVHKVILTKEDWEGNQYLSLHELKSNPCWEGASQLIKQITSS